ncbi:MAG: phosphoribosylaminoimidazolesuccinocarboxamide synthase [Acidobacteria bacterium 37-71-11]|nr:MAG: phosphoribosylaminoimidazolesuccinocarboxamide synthase [Acidobacteria bacterium 37-71-11]HQT93601.1 phosphoribosylaminoimidazolesuccinocarboxamide synthase [Thermoanaerobaculaceae bacterium]
MPAPFPSAPLFPGRLLRRGKVRDVYQADGERLVIVASDRISAFDAVLDPGVPGKGVVLTQLSNFWFERLADVVPNHLVATRLADFPQPFSGEVLLDGRACLATAVRIAPVECVVRGFIAGSGWKEYQARGSVCGVSLPPGLRQADRLPAPVFTPSTKAEVGHDENIPFDEVVRLVGGEVADQLRTVSLELYRRAAQIAEARGIIIADTKFEFGLDDEGKLVWADEALTPDSSRFWPADLYRPGTSPPSFDKQFVRDWLEGCGWDKRPPAPMLPPEVVARTRALYLEAYRRLTGCELALG